MDSNRPETKEKPTGNNAPIVPYSPDPLSPSDTEPGLGGVYDAPVSSKHPDSRFFRTCPARKTRPFMVT